MRLRGSGQGTLARLHGRHGPEAPSCHIMSMFFSGVVLPMVAVVISVLDMF